MYMKKTFLFILVLLPFLGMSQTNKGNSYIEVKTGLSASDVTKDTKPILGYNFNMAYSYGLFENMDLMASLSSYDAFSTEDIPSYVQQMYFSNALQLGVRGRIRCLNIVNLKLSLSGGMMVLAYNDIFYHASYPMSEMMIRPCVSGMAEIDFSINERIVLGVYYGKAIVCDSYAKNPYFDSAGLTLSLNLQ